MRDNQTLWAVGHLTVDDVILWDGETHFRSAGGAALYAGIGASLFGIPSRVVTRLGDGYPVGELDRFRALGVELVPSSAGEPCISQWVLYEADGSRTFVLHPNSGSLDRMSPSPADYKIPRAAALHVAPMPVAEQLAWCRSASATKHLITVDPHEYSCESEPSAVRQMLGVVDAFLPSALEASLLAGSDPVDAALFFRASGAPIAAVKLGADGSVVATDEGVWHVPAVNVDVVDVTGAGDSYCGAFAAALATGLSGLEAARAATAVASVVVGVHGASLTSFAEARRAIADRIPSIEPTLLTQLTGTEAGTIHFSNNRRNT